MRIDVTNLSKIIRGSVILDNISIHFESGHIYGIIGKNGSGKTMLLRAISGLIVPSSGVVYVDGKALGTEISFPPEIGILIWRDVSPVLDDLREFIILPGGQQAAFIVEIDVGEMVFDFFHHLLIAYFPCVLVLYEILLHLLQRNAIAVFSDLR